MIRAQVEKDNGKKGNVLDLGIAIERQYERGVEFRLGGTHAAGDSRTPGEPPMEQNRNGTVKISWRGGDRFDIQIRRHTVRIDQSRDFGGGDTGPDPVELLVGSLAACVAHRAERYLHRCELPAGVTVTAHYDLDVRPARVGRIELVVEAPGVPEGLRDSFTTVIEHSAVHNSLRLPPEIVFRIRTTEDAPATDRTPPYPPRAYPRDPASSQDVHPEETRPA